MSAVYSGHDLIVAVYRHDVQELVDSVDEVLAAHPPLGAFTTLLDACVADGSVRPGLDPADVPLLMGYLWRAGPGADGIAQGRRLTGIVLDGIRTGRPGDQRS
jgi:hypothetical protein